MMNWALMEVVDPTYQTIHRDFRRTFFGLFHHDGSARWETMYGAVLLPFVASFVYFRNIFETRRVGEA